MNQDRSDEVERTDVWRVECGCGFNATGDDGPLLRYMLDGHACAARANHRVSLAEAIFSFWGYMVIMALALIAAVIFGGGS